MKSSSAVVYFSGTLPSKSPIQIMYMFDLYDTIFCRARLLPPWGNHFTWFPFNLKLASGETPPGASPPPPPIISYYWFDVSRSRSWNMGNKPFKVGWIIGRENLPVIPSACRLLVPFDRKIPTPNGILNGPEPFGHVSPHKMVFCGHIRKEYV